MCEVTSWQMALLAGFAVLEYWLGQTDIVKSNSTIALVLNVVKGFIKTKK